MEFMEHGISHVTANYKSDPVKQFSESSCIKCDKSLWIPTKTYL